MLSCFRTNDTSNCCQIIHNVCLNKLKIDPLESNGDPILEKVIELSHSNDKQSTGIQLLNLLNKQLMRNRDNQLEEHFLAIIITFINDLKKFITEIDDSSINIIQQPLKLLISSKSDNGLNGPAIMFFASIVFGLLFKFHKFPPAINLYKVLVNIKIDSNLSDPTSILYNFNLGKCQLIQNNNILAYNTFNQCLSFNPPNKLKFKLYIYLFPLHFILFNEIPKRKIFNEFKELKLILPFYEAINALDMERFNKSVAEYQYLLLKSNVFSLYIQMGNLLELRIFKRTFEIWNSFDPIKNTHIIPLGILKYANDVDKDYIETKVMGLISQNRIKGYISHGNQVVVLSKKDPFPSFN